MAITAVHALSGFIFARVLLGPLRETLSRHPDGAAALWADDGRYLFDVLHKHSDLGAVSLDGFASLMVVFALGWCLFGGVLPALAIGARPPSVFRAAAESLRRAPTLIALATVTGLAFVLATALAWQSWRWALDPSTAAASGNAAHARALASMIPAAVLVFAVSIWHDTARSIAISQNITAHRAALAAGLSLLRRPLSTAATALGFSLVGWSFVALPIAMAAVLEPAVSTAAVWVLVVVRLAALTAKLHARMRWFRWLNQREG